MTCDLVLDRALVYANVVFVTSVWVEAYKCTYCTYTDTYIKPKCRRKLKERGL